MSFATIMQATSLRLLKKYGSLATGTRAIPTTYNTATSTMSFTGATTYTGYGNASPYTLEEMTNSTIETSDLKFLFYSPTTRPAVNDIMDLGEGISYRVLKVDIANVNSMDVVYTLQLRV
jgi:hypothetical protein